MQHIVTLFTQSFSHFKKKEGIQMAAALSYFSLFATAPILIILMSSLEIFLSDVETQNTILFQVHNLFGPYVATILANIIQNITTHPSQSSFNGIISFILLLVTATTIIRQLQNTLNKMWNVEEKKVSLLTRILRRLLATIFLLLLALLILLSFLFNTLLSYFESFIGIDISSYYFISSLISFITITLLFFIIFKYLPDADMRTKDIIWGVLFTSILFLIGKHFISIYLGRTTYTSIYGAAGSILGFLAWVYYSYLMFLFGSALTYTYARLYGKGIHPLKK